MSIVLSIYVNLCCIVNRLEDCGVAPIATDNNSLFSYLVKRVNTDPSILSISPVVLWYM